MVFSSFYLPKLTSRLDSDILVIMSIYRPMDNVNHEFLSLFAIKLRIHKQESKIPESMAGDFYYGR